MHRPIEVGTVPYFQALGYFQISRRFLHNENMFVVYRPIPFNLDSLFTFFAYRVGLGNWNACVKYSQLHVVKSNFAILDRNYFMARYNHAAAQLMLNRYALFMNIYVALLNMLRMLSFD